MKVCLKIFLVLFYSISAYAQVGNDILELRNKYCYDSRTCIFEVELDSTSNKITGKTSNLDLFIALKESSAFRTWTNNVVLLPNSNDTFKKWAIVNVSVANLRSHPQESAELASQALLGMPLKVFEKQKGWYRVQTPDKYIGWIDGLSISFKTEEEIQNYKKCSKIIITAPYSTAFSASNKNALPISDLSFGNVLLFEKKTRKYTVVTFPDKRKAFVKNKHVFDLEKWIEKAIFDTDRIAEYSKNLMGIPYLWGGTSFKGVDCSGFTRTSFFSAGVLLPRDASQQQFLGKNILFENSFETLVKGDLIFFGKKENQKATHVAIYLEDMKFIHSSGMVRINSLDSNDANFDEYNANRILFVKRMEKNDIVPISEIYFNK